jgi:NAD(P)-dependent dehydrogenase (short-subunit alcohol dehydrogenase family)
MAISRKPLKKQVIVIMGAASGSGKGAALKFAQAGAAVVLAARRGQLLDELVRDCEAAGGRALAVATDVGNPADVEQLARAAISQFGRIDVWVNHAGIGAIGRFEEVPLIDHIQVIETDLLGTIYGSYFALRQFRQQQSGTLINVASALGELPAPYYASYVAARHGVVGLSVALQEELERDNIEGIRICTVIPASFDTPLFDQVASYTGHEAQSAPPVYEPEEIDEVIVSMVLDPEAKVSVSAAAKVMTFAHPDARRIIESMMGEPSEEVPGRRPKK